MIPKIKVWETITQDSNLVVNISIFGNKHIPKQTEKALAPCLVQNLGGIGNKLCYVLEHKSDVYYCPQPGVYTWDLCAVECLIVALGGVVKTLKGALISYEHYMFPGLCGTLKEEIFDEVIR